MSPATLSLLALLAVILLSLTSRINVGILAVALAFPVGIYSAGWKPEVVLGLFPSALFLTLAGVTLLFGIAQENGTLGVLARRGVRLCGGTPALLPPLFFGLTCVLSMIGPGAIAASALVAPLALSAGLTAGVSPFLMALMVANGGNAGNLSPFSAVGVIVHAQMEKIGLPNHDGSVFAANFVAHAMVAAVAYLLFGGRKLLRAPRVASVGDNATPLTGRQWFTLVILIVWISGVVVLKINPGLSAFAAAALLIMARTVEDHVAVAAVPWSVLLMVSGVSVLVGVLEKTGGMELFSGLLARIATPGTANGAMAFVTGLISTYSSTSGVVYPAFLPMVPGLVAKLGGGNPLEVALSINVGAAIVDVSPLSTIGALCVAGLPAGGDAKRLFRQMLLWGLSMVVVGAVFCQLFIRFFAP
jgi:Na+/H+ antiporter NhaD/arsenite permease-like protein